MMGVMVEAGMLPQPRSTAFSGRVFWPSEGRPFKTNITVCVAYLKKKKNSLLTNLKAGSPRSKVSGELVSSKASLVGLQMAIVFYLYVTWSFLYVRLCPDLLI